MNRLDVFRECFKILGRFICPPWISFKKKINFKILEKKIFVLPVKKKWNEQKHKLPRQQTFLFGDNYCANGQFEL